MNRKNTDLDLIRRLIGSGFEDLKLSIQREPPPIRTVEEVVKTKRRPAQRTIQYSGSPNTVSRTGTDDSGVTEVSSVYDLAECIRLQDIESYFAVSVDRHLELMMKRGYQLRGSRRAMP